MFVIAYLRCIIHALFSRSAPIHNTLTVLACSFLHPSAPTGVTLKLLLTMPKLKKVDIRKRVEEVC